MDDQCVSETALVVPERLCNSCGLSKPLEDFGFQNRDKGVRHSRCSSCLAQYYRAHRLQQRRRELKDYLDQASDASNPANYGATTRVEAIVRGMMARFGGLDKFAQFWFDFVQHARESGKEHLVQRSLEALARFIELTDRNRADQPSGDESEAEANEVLRRYALSTLFEEPELGVAALEGLGYRVERPADSSGSPSVGDYLRGVEARVSDACVDSPSGQT